MGVKFDIEHGFFDFTLPRLTGRRNGKKHTFNRGLHTVQQSFSSTQYMVCKSNGNDDAAIDKGVNCSFWAVNNVQLLRRTSISYTCVYAQGWASFSGYGGPG
jgi:hypothetical protein